ncbi:MAG: HDOD domain-containing protein [Clostridia bacterium]|nr:HDOD domain-containing protein [Clostridia bacterium]
MKVPSISKAELMLHEASVMNPGLWVKHNQVAAFCARRIAERCSDLDNDSAYVLGLLHDIGRRFGEGDLIHTLRGYKYMIESYYVDSARICLTHSFPYKDLQCYEGINDCTNNETEFLSRYIKRIDYNDYDRLIQLADAISDPEGPCIMEKRLVNVVMRKGFNEFTILKWKEFFTLKEYFEAKMRCTLDELFRF